MTEINCEFLVVTVQIMKRRYIEVDDEIPRSRNEKGEILKFH